MSILKKLKLKRGTEPEQPEPIKSTLLEPLTEHQDGGYPETEALADSKPLILCTSLEQILLSDWIEIEANQDYSKLVISGEPTEEQLADAWVLLRSRYHYLINKEEAESYRADTSDMESIIMKLNAINMLVYGGRLILNGSMAQWLNENGTDYTASIVEQLQEWGFAIEELTEENLQRVELLLKHDELQLEMLQAAEKEAPAKKNEIPTVQKAREDYTQMLMQIEEHRKIRYSLEDVNVFQFAVMYGQLREYVNYMKNLNKKD